MAQTNQTNVQINDQAQNQNPNKAPSKTLMVNKASGAILLIFLFGIFWVYGWAGEIRYANTSGFPTTGLSTLKTNNRQTQTIFGNLYVIDTIFVVIGFGLLLSYFKKSTTSAFFTTIFTVSFTMLASPIFSKFWYNIFMSNFQGLQIKTADPSRFYHYSLGSLAVYLDYYNLRIALANSISQLVVCLVLFGRLNALQVIVNTLLFNFIWNLNHFLCVYFNKISPDLRIFDDYQISNVYLFAATYGFIASLLQSKPQTQHTPQFSSSHNSVVIAHLGTFFLFLSFCATTTMFSLKYTLTSDNERSYIWQQAFISIFIAMSASIIFNYAFSILFNPNSKIGIRGSLVGTITGAIMYGSVAGTSINIGAAIAIGLVAGFVSALFFQKIYPTLNKNQIKDSFGGLVILFVSFLGTFLVAPTVIKTYYNYNVDLPTLYPSNSPTQTYQISNKDAVGWCLVNVGVSIGIGLFGGLVIGAILRFFQKVTRKYYDDSQIVSGRYGLREITNRTDQQIVASAQHLQQQ